MPDGTVRSRARESVQLSYQLIRNTTSPDEKSSGVQSFVANLPAAEILKLDTDDNLRAYIAEYNPRKRNRVHEAIWNTIHTAPERFITRNGGFVITATSANVDDSAKTVELNDASIINGAQSQGEIKRYFSEIIDLENPDELVENPFFIRAEIIVDPEPAEIVETAIARNTATPVKYLTQVGGRGQLNELAASIQAVFPNTKIRMSETDEDVDFETQRVLQWSRLLMPAEISKNSSAAEILRAYKNPAQCLTDFSDWYENRHRDEGAKARYEFTIQIAPYAIMEYEHWEKHDGWNRHRIWEETKNGGRACRRDRKTRKVVWVAPGLVYPILGAMSEFVVKSADGKWKIEKPSQFKGDDMIRRAVAQFRAHDSDPMLLGRSEGAYDALRIYPETLMEILREPATQAT